MFLIFNVITMSTCSTLVIMRRYSEYAVVGLIAVVVIQALGYGLIFDLNFFLRNLSVMGGLLMVLGDSAVKKSRAFAGLPSIDEKDKKMYIQLSGRILLIFLFIGFVFSGEWGVGRIIISLFGLMAVIMVVIGFKAKLSAVLLVMLLSVFNVIVNNFWTVSEPTLLRFRDVLTDVYSCTLTTLTRISPSMTFSRSSLSLADFSCWSIWVPDRSVSMKRRRFIKNCFYLDEYTIWSGYVLQSYGCRPHEVHQNHELMSTIAGRLCL